jgi:serine/threonine-protein kinase
MKYGRYEIVKELGHGAMGVVYQAHDPRIDRSVALKVLRPDRVTSQDFVLRFLKEAKAIGRLSHANIVTVYDVGQDQDTIYIAMEFLEGRPLNEVVNEKPPAIRDVINIGLQVAKALNYAHARGIIHRDIKPSNIILNDEGRVKITDFGIARIEDPEATQQTQAGEILGTPVYMSPEQVMGKTVDGRSDLYSLGIILYELTTGARPFTGENIAVIFRAITQDIPPMPQTADGNLPPAIASLIMKSMAKQPEKRFQSGRQMADELTVCLDSKKNTGVSANARPDKKGHLSWIGLIVLILVCGGGFYLLNSRQSVQAPPPVETAPLKQPMAETPSGIEAKASAPADTIAETPINSETAQVEIQESTSTVEEKTASSRAGTEQKKKSTDKKKAAYSLLKIDSVPTNAQVFIDDAFKGKTPVDLSLPLGKHEVLVTLRGYYEWEAGIDLDTHGETPLYVRLIAEE